MKNLKALSTYLIILTLFNFQTKGSVLQNIDSRDINKKEYNVSALEWKLWGYRPESWKMDFNFIELSGPKAEYINLPVTVPGSVQKALKDAGIIEDWNIGNNYINIEWIENRHWIFVTRIPDEWVKNDCKIVLKCLGLDDNGVIMVNGKEAGNFSNTFIPYIFDITSFLKDKNNTLAIVFKCPPSYLGQIGYTSKIKDWKPRFYYGWDWIPRIVQIGIWDDIRLQVIDKDYANIEEIRIETGADKIKDIGNLKISADLTAMALSGKVRIQLSGGADIPVIDETIPATQLREGVSWDNLKIKRWWPNGSGEQNLYKLVCTLFDVNGITQQVIEKKLGFKNVEWLPCRGALPESDPWLCSVNNKPVFLQGVNWSPIRPNFADLKESDYRKLISTYKNLGVNIFRVWGGGFPEKEWLYNICDEMGIMLWQEFPLSSSGLDNFPPVSPEEIFVMSKISENYVKRLRDHVSVLLWCGGNELYELGDIAPVNDKHPMIRCMKEIVKAEDPGRRFVTGSPSGPTIYGGLHNFGKHVSWDVHGPWTLPFTATDRTMNAVRNFWSLDDALIHSEVGVAGAMSANMINKYRGKFPALPANMNNMLWRQVSWWIEWNDFLNDHNGEEPLSLDEYVAWSQERQTTGLVIALKANKLRFPGCGGFIIWMGHDSYPCPVNTSIIDFDGNLKPAAIELGKIWKAGQGK
jgi:beta-mannosidase